MKVTATLSCVVCFCGLIGGSTAHAAIEVVSVTSGPDDDIVIPAFDTNLGTLLSAAVDVELMAGTTDVAGAHDHASTTILSSNTRSNPLVSGIPTIVHETAVSGAHSHSIVTPAYSGGGVTVGSFNLSTSLDGNHVHSALGSYNGLVSVGPSAYRARVVVDSSPGGATSATYPSVSKSLTFSGPSLTPFLGGSDVVITAGPMSASAIGNHSHVLPGFSATVSSNTGPWTWNFASNSLAAAGSHTHSLDPSFRTVARYTYETLPPVVPEATSFATWLCLGACGAAYRRRS